MGQEQFAGPEYFTEFDPEKFLHDMRAQADASDDNDPTDKESKDPRGVNDA